MRRPHWRKMTWVLIVWSVLIVLWAISAGGGNHCDSESTRLATESCEAGSGVAALLVLLIGFFGFAFFSLIWFMTRSRRACPACGENVKKGHTACPGCGHDFAAALKSSPEPQSG